MSKLTDFSAIKLFGKTIPLPTLNQQEKALPDHHDQDSKEKQILNDKQQDSSQQKALKKPDKILPCPRCNSKETKFCYYNNYNVNQPRHFCKNCQRYWTAGGTMRNVPVGAGRRKTKTSSALHYHHIMISEAIRAAQATAANGTLTPQSNNNNSNGHVLTFGSDACVFNFNPNPFPSLPRHCWPYPTKPLCPQGFPITVGKHGRDHDHDILISSSISEVGRKTLRIDDDVAGESAKSSMIAKLVMHSGGLFDGFESKSSSDERNFRSIQALSVLQANPAALSRSLNLHENT